MIESPLSSPAKVEHHFRKIAILFAGGPAPAANAVISTAAVSFLRNDIKVVGMLNGYSHLVEYSKDKPLVAGRDYVMVDHKLLRRTRNSQGIMIGTARTNPGKDISHPSHLDDPARCAPLRAVYEALCSLEVDALVSIGGDDTLKSANKFKLFQDRLPADAKRIPVVHLPKTIDNDYMGIDFTFGFFTAVDTIAGEIRNLLADAEANLGYYLTEVMGRGAGWLAYGSAIAGEASLAISVEDIIEPYAEKEEYTHAKSGERRTRTVMNIAQVIDRIVQTMRDRENEGKQYGVIVVAEGLAEYLPAQYLEDIPRDDHDHINIAQVGLGRMLAKAVGDEYHRQTGRKRKVTGLQLGYEARCARPNSFDVMLGSQLGVGAYRAIVEERLNGVMVSVSGQLELHYVEFEKLVNPETLVTVVRQVPPESDFHKLVRFLETYVNKESLRLGEHK